MGPTLIYSVIAAAAVVFVGIIAWLIHRQTLRYQALVVIQKDYRSHQMGYAVDRLWRFYREHCQGDENTLRQEYHRIYKKEQKEVDAEEVKQIEARETTLDNQRRVVSRFYQHLAALYVHKILPPEYIFENWSKHDLVIIPCILIPMENALRDIIKAEGAKLPESACAGELPRLEEDSSLCMLYKESLRYPHKKPLRYPQDRIDVIYLLKVGLAALYVLTLGWVALIAR